MTSIVYTATRTIASGHTLGNSYTLDFDAQEMLPDKEIMKDSSKSLDGSEESVLHYIARVWRARTDILAQSELELWHEFFDSVSNNEVFTFDAHGTSGTPDNSQSVVMSEGESVSSVGPLNYEFSFSVRAL